MLPRLVHLACASEVHTRERERVVPRARGRVVELGMGSGLNLPHYDPGAVERVLGVEPSRALVRRASRAALDVPFDVEIVPQSAEERLPLADATVDTVVVTYALCTIPDPVAALAEARRVLAPEGRLLFLEHGAVPDAGVRRWQERLDPVWRRLAGGCRLAREIPAIVEDAGFSIDDLDAGYVDGPRIASWTFRGAASPAS